MTGPISGGSDLSYLYQALAAQQTDATTATADVTSVLQNTPDTITQSPQTVSVAGQNSTEPSSPQLFPR